MYKVLGEDYIDLLIDNVVADNLKWDYDLTKINERYSILYFPGEMLDICYLGYRPYHIFPTIYTLCSDIVLESSGISFVQSSPNFNLYWDRQPVSMNTQKSIPAGIFNTIDVESGGDTFIRGHPHVSQNGPDF